jgi:hypothetical protein
MSVNLSAQAKAVATAAALFLVQVQVFIGQGGVDALTAVTLGQWITVVLGVLAGYGVVYNIPNAEAAPPVDDTKGGVPGTTMVNHIS